jgi:hypothetical protein
LPPSEVASRIYTNSRSQEPENPENFPVSLAEQYTNEMYKTGEDVLKGKFVKVFTPIDRNVD